MTGDTVNTAARLLGGGSAGTILVSEATHALTRHRFAFEPAGELALRGKAEPIVVHRLLGALAEPRSARGLAAHGLAAPMVGRTDELDQLLAAFDRMQRGRAQVVSLVGEAGTGKSRLIAEFLGRLEADGRLAGTAVRRAACSSLGEPTYGVFGALFREGYQVEPDDSLDVARQKLAAGLQSLGRPSRGGGGHRAGAELRARGGGGAAPRLRARAAQAPDRAGRAHAGRAAPGAGAAPDHRGGSPLGRRGLGGPAAGRRRPSGGPASDDAGLASPRRAAAARGPGRAVHHPARPALPRRDAGARGRPVRRGGRGRFRRICRISSRRGPGAIRCSSRRSSGAW